VFVKLTHRLNGLDHLRALAISYVFIYHYAVLFKHPAWLGPLANFGWSGVDLFFVLSGYLIGGQLLGRVAGGQEISIKRLLRSTILEDHARILGGSRILFCDTGSD
jgi:peptidoglycan/LPS O-acetylase OafA/YrhL